MSHLLMLGLVACTSALFGLLFNGYIVLVLIYNRQIRTANNLLLLHLALVDIISSIELLAVTTPSAIQGQWPGRESMCIAHGFVWTALLPIVVWTLCGLNCDRYAAIASPLHYSRLVRSKRIVVFLVVIWFLGLLLALPPLFKINRYVYHSDRAVCLADFTDRSSGRWYPLVYTSLTIVLPALLILLCNLRILSIAHHHRHRIVSAIYEVTVRAQATITHQRNPFYLSKYKGRCAVVTILQLVGSLIVLYGPHCGVMFWELSSGRQSDPEWAAAAVALVACATPLNGFVYGVKSPVLRKTFKNFLRKQLYTSEVHNEIQRRGSVTNNNRGWSTLLSRMPAASAVPSRLQSNMSKPQSNSPISERSLPSTPLPRVCSIGTFRSEGHSASNTDPDLGHVTLTLGQSMSTESLSESENVCPLVVTTTTTTTCPLTTTTTTDSNSVIIHCDNVQKDVTTSTNKEATGQTEADDVSVVSPVQRTSSSSLSEQISFFKKKNGLSVRSLSECKFSLEKLQNGHLKNSFHKVFSPHLCERGSI